MCALPGDGAGEPGDGARGAGGRRGGSLDSAGEPHAFHLLRPRWPLAAPATAARFFAGCAVGRAGSSWYNVE